MNEPKPFASLSSSLLARKGHAKPAMRPQGFQMLPESGPRVIHHNFQPDQDDLGWNDMGFDGQLPTPVAYSEEPDRVAPVAPPPVVAQQEQLLREFSPSPAVSDPRKPMTRAAPGSKGKAAFTLRLDSERHLRLRLVCAVNHRSAQQIVTMALDEYLARQPENAVLTAKAG